MPIWTFKSSREYDVDEGEDKETGLLPVPCESGGAIVAPFSANVANSYSISVEPAEL